MTTEIPVLDYGFVQYVDHMGSDLRIVEAARLSYKQPSKGPEQDRKLLFYLWKHKHTSPFEMCKITFNIKLPIFVMRQFVRHRMQNLNELSGRYSQLPNQFYIPECWRGPDQKNRQGSIPDKELDKSIRFVMNDTYIEEFDTTTSAYIAMLKSCYSMYEVMLKQGIATEMARLVLPVSIYTEIYSTWDLKNLFHYFSLRDDPHATWEHQEYARAMKVITRERFPWAMEAYDRFKFPCVEQEIEPCNV